MKRVKIYRYKGLSKQVISKIQEIHLSDTDRITYIFKYSKPEKKEIKVLEVTNVSYEIFINEQWITIIRYDSAHGFLHKHIRISLDNPIDTPQELGVRKEDAHAGWLTWAISDIKTNFRYYKKEFLIRLTQNLIVRACRELLDSA